MKNKKLLTQLMIDEISGVDKGANQGARVAFWKRHINNDSGENQMNIEELAKKLDEQTAKIEKMEAEKAELELFSKMTDAEKAHVEKMSKDEIKSFMALSSDERKEQIGKSEKEQEDVTKSDETDADAEAITKSQYDAILKQNEDLADKITKMEAENALAEFSKSAEKELPNFAAKAEDKGAFLKALHNLSAKDRDVVMAEMKKANDIIADYMVEKGTSQGNDEENPNVKLDTLAKNYAQEHKVDYDVAMDAVTKTEDGKALYEQTLSS